MANLKIRDFSCIENADVDVKKLTVLIGPQASGKSIISKLVYFFYSVARSQVGSFHIYTEKTQFIDELSDRFKKWFPVSAWGSKKFEIEFYAGDISIKFHRKKAYKGRPSEDFHILFSEEFDRLFASISDQYLQIQKGRGSKNSKGSFELPVYFMIRPQVDSMISKVMGDDFVESQMFVPAGRSFFTSVGKAIAVFEQGEILDPVTREFGRYWAAIRDRRYLTPFGPFSSLSNKDLMSEIFGGRLVQDRDIEYVQSDDGRKIPLTALSSGQQELLPLWMALQTAFNQADSKTLIYIEEPEAHLFPQAQSKLIQHLAGLVAGPKERRKMMITTHSPYVLAKINNLLKAGALGYRSAKERQEIVSSIIPKSSWIDRRNISAYAIEGGSVVSILGDDGLINGEYLDGVSLELGSEFDELLDVQYSTNRRGMIKK